MDLALGLWGLGLFAPLSATGGWGFVCTCLLGKGRVQWGIAGHLRRGPWLSRYLSRVYKTPPLSRKVAKKLSYKQAAEQTSSRPPGPGRTVLVKWWGVPSSSRARPPQGHCPGERRARATRPCPLLRVPVSLGHQRLSCLGPSVPHTDFPQKLGVPPGHPQRSPHHPQDWSPDHMTCSPPRPAWTLIRPFGHPGAGWSEKTHREGLGKGPLVSPQPRGLWGPCF